MSDRVAVFNAGRIEQVGTPAEVYERPATAFVAGFVGTSNLLSGLLAAAQASRAATASFSIRPEKLRIAGTGDVARLTASCPRTARSPRSSTSAPRPGSSSTSTLGGRLIAVQQNLSSISDAVKLRPPRLSGSETESGARTTCLGCEDMHATSVCQHEAGSSTMRTRLLDASAPPAVAVSASSASPALAASAATSCSSAGGSGESWRADSCPRSPSSSRWARARARSTSSSGPATPRTAATTRPSTGSTRSRRRPAARSTSRSATPPTRWSP